MKIIPAIDLIDGKCVRLTKGDFNTKKIYSTDPLEVAKSFQDCGIQYLHLVDLDGTRAKKIVNYPILEQLASQTNLSIDFGGGIQSEEDLRIAFDSGAQQITGGSIALKNPALFCDWLDRYGADKIILGADCKGRMIATGGWLEESNQDVIDFVQKFAREGVRQVISTDISRDGMLLGPSLELYSEILEHTAVDLIASGGISSIEDLMKLKEIGCAGAILGKAIYEGRIALNELTALC